MRVGICADIHGNATALTAVLDDCESRGGVDIWLCAGDVSGHLPMVNEVCQLLLSLSLPLVAVRGNHDHALLTGASIPRSVSATRALNLQRETISAQCRAFLSALPYRQTIDIDGSAVAIIHGGPRDPLDEYLYHPDLSTAALISEDILVHGHTHVPYVATFAGRNFINPGSIGMPLDGDPRAAYAVWHTDSLRIDTRRVSYDPQPVILRLREAGFDERYPNCLLAGRWIGPTIPS
jgi:putative phosphoesterase